MRGGREGGRERETTRLTYRLETRFCPLQLLLLLLVLRVLLAMMLLAVRWDVGVGKESRGVYNTLGVSSEAWPASPLSMPSLI